jgi:hypothetical protein
MVSFLRVADRPFPTLPQDCRSRKNTILFRDAQCWKARGTGSPAAAGAGVDRPVGRVLALDWVPTRPERPEGLIAVYDGGVLTTDRPDYYAGGESWGEYARLAARESGVEDQVATAIAAALAAKVADGLTEGGKLAFRALARLVRRKLGGDSAASTALEEAELDPSNGARLQELRAALEAAMSADPVFAAEMRRLWRGVQEERAGGRDDVINNFSGTARGNVLQARDVHGGISFGAPPVVREPQDPEAAT